MADNAGKTVAEILRTKKASIKDAALDPGSPSWDDILQLTWEDLTDRAKRREPGYKTIKKLLGSREYDK
jgi:hypothetical protein